LNSPFGDLAKSITSIVKHTIWFSTIKIYDRMIKSPPIGICDMSLENNFQGYLCLGKMQLHNGGDEWYDSSMGEKGWGLKHCPKTCACFDQCWTITKKRGCENTQLANCFHRTHVSMFAWATHCSSDLPECATHWLSDGSSQTSKTRKSSCSHTPTKQIPQHVSLASPIHTEFNKKENILICIADLYTSESTSFLLVQCSQNTQLANTVLYLSL
jgi:hypothetical protein